MDIIFDCQTCGQSIEVDKTGAGMVVNCPKCDALLTVPHPSRPTAAMPPPIQIPRSRPTEKKCPFCSESIHIDAKKCKHCGEFLTNSTLSKPATSNANQEKMVNPIRIVLMVVAVGFIVVGLADGEWFYVGFGLVLLFLAAIAK